MVKFLVCNLLKVGKTKAKALTNYIEQKIEHDLDLKTKILATKEVLAEVRTKISVVKSDILKWMFGMFITLVVMILGLYDGLFLKN